MHQRRKNQIIPLVYSVCGRIASGLVLLMTVALMGGCTVADPEYAGVLASAHTDCKGTEIAGVWSNSSQMLQARAVKAYVLLLRPDGTGFRRTIYVDPNTEATTTQLLWRYQGAGIWTSGTATIRFAGNALAWQDNYGGATFLDVYIRAGNESFSEIMKPNP